MPWQDLVITAGQVVFFVALIPSLRSSEKPALATSLMTGGILLTYAATFATLSLWSSVIPTVVLAAGWFALAWQKHHTNRS